MKKHNLNLIYNKYSEEELEDNINSFSKWDWAKISCHQKLSEQFIERHADKIDWNFISAYQKLSKEFIKKYIKKININWLIHNENISEEMKKEIKTLKEIR